MSVSHFQEIALGLFIDHLQLGMRLGWSNEFIALLPVAIVCFYKVTYIASRFLLSFL